VIGLREGLEASLIVGIIAAFLRRNASAAGLRQMWLGVLAAVVLCIGAGLALDIVASDLPQRQQEGLETVIAAVAVGMVTYMIVWMKAHSRDLKGSLESAAGSALAHSSAVALSAMAFLAVLREGLETVVFLLAAFEASGSAGSAALGAGSGIVVSLCMGYAIYRGGVRINISRFFRATGVVLAVVAAGLVMSALHTAHEAGWLDLGQEGTFSLRWLAAPGSVQASLLTGVLGIQPGPALVEVIGWLVYVIPVIAIVCWPPTVPAPWRLLSRGLLASAGASLVAAIAVAVAAPALPATAARGTGSFAVTQATTPGAAAAVVGASTASGTLTTRETIAVRSASAKRLAVRWLFGDTSTVLRLQAQATEPLDGVTTTVYRAAPTQLTPVPASAVAGMRTLTLAQLSAATSGRLPLGVSAQTVHGPMRVRYATSTVYRVYLDPTSDAVVDARRVAHTVATLALPSGSATSLGLVSTTASAGTTQAVSRAAAAVVHHASVADRREWMRVRWPVTLVLLAGGAAACAWWLRSKSVAPRPVRRAPVRMRGTA
jgi:high-affinity iron transporter